MNSNIPSSTVLPDITSHSFSDNPNKLAWVGMEKIAIPLLVETKNKAIMQVGASADVYVNLDKSEAKGIHMSRLHGLINNMATHNLTPTLLNSTLEKMVQSQKGISTAAKVKLSFELVLQKPSLISNEFGFQSYPIDVIAEYKNSESVITLNLTIPYSSTCPCSASLSRQALHDVIDAYFNETLIDKSALLQWIKSKQGTVATPHSQRSYAYIQLSLINNAWPNLPELISDLEHTIGTPVQTVVKREDEQAFAKLNAENLLFCEDAARRVKHKLEHTHFVADYWFKVEHQESLHAHNAVAIDKKYPTTRKM